MTEEPASAQRNPHRNSGTGVYLYQHSTSRDLHLILSKQAYRRSAKCELREHLGPVKDAAQCRRLKSLFRDHKGIARIDAQIIERVSPDASLRIAAYNFSISPNDKCMLPVCIPGRPACLSQVHSDPSFLGIEEGILVVHRADHIHAGWNVRDDKAVAILHCKIGEIAQTLAIGLEFQYETPRGADLAQARNTS